MKFAAMTCKIFQKSDRTVNLKAKVFQVRDDRLGFSLVFTIHEEEKYVMELLIKQSFQEELKEYFKKFKNLKEPALNLELMLIETKILATWG